jgi:CubicO group peptidase (beta-lactamase class C family)
VQLTRRTIRCQNGISAALLLLNVGFLPASAGPLQGQTAAAVAKLAPYEAKENANRQAKEWIARGTPGLALAVAIDGKIVYSEGFGFADHLSRHTCCRRAGYEFDRS